MSYAPMDNSQAKKIYPSPLTQQRLKSLYSFDPESGVFTRITHRNRLIPLGSRAGTLTRSRKQYLVIRIDRKLYLCHRLAWLYVYGNFPAGFLDHINGDGTDNRIKNLREVTNVENLQASTRIPKHNTSGFKGVYFNKKTKKWVAGISLEDKRRHLGSFDSPDDAYQCYLDAKSKMHFR